MGTKLSPRGTELYQRVDEVLHFLWDPIGVSWEPNARDEYHLYLPRVFALLNDSADREGIAQYLTTVRTERMGMRSGDVEHDRRIAELLITWKELIWENYEARS